LQARRCDVWRHIYIIAINMLLPDARRGTLDSTGNRFNRL
jgi:hypothetical protein